ncbi:MAG: phosphoribosylformylglycinamidine synthase [Lentimonas sp.]|jgi:phosphoribosylformylglycinamidine synthase
MNNQNIFESLKTLVSCPDLGSKRWVYEQYDSQVMGDTIAIGGDAAVVRVHGTNKALAITSDCTPRYVEADAFEGAKQAVAETYRNICAVGGKPMAITNCLNFGNPQKPKIMGQIVRSIKGINEACKALSYPVVSGNVSLYNETDGKAILPTPAIGGVGLLKDLTKRCDTKFKNEGDIVFVIGRTIGHLDCSLFEREVLKIRNHTNPPKVDLELEKENGEFIREIIGDNLINSCHDISDGGLLVALFEMCNEKLGVKIDNDFLNHIEDKNALLFGEDQGRYIVSLSPKNADLLVNIVKDIGIEMFKIGHLIRDKIEILNQNILIKDLQLMNESALPSKL